MRIPWALLAQNATLEAGRLDILGVIYHVHAETVPVAVVDVRMVVRLVAEPPDKGSTHELELRLVEPDGAERHLGRGELRIGDSEGGGSVDDVQILPIRRLEFFHFGRHELHLRLDGGLAAMVDIELRPSAH